MLSVFRKFKLKGNRPFLRTDEEMKSIDKKEADKAFKLYHCCPLKIVDG